MALTRAASILATVLLLVAASPPEEVKATECTNDYLMCVNSATQLDSPFEELGSVECAAEWVGCVAGKLRWW